MSEPSQIVRPKLLDCTLRDGGYYTSWDFSDEVVNTYLEAMSRLPVDIVELGYCNPPKSGYFGRYHYLSHDVTSSARRKLRPEQSLAVMIDEKQVTPVQAEALLAPHIGIVNIVRIAAVPTRLLEAAALAKQIEKLGFDVCINVMYLSQYWESVGSLSHFVGLDRHCTSVALVDSYGACLPHQVAHATAEAKLLLPAIDVGFHGHDNLGLAISNSLSALEAGATIIDATVMGMGRGPGNTRMELVLANMFAQGLVDVDLSVLQQTMQDFDELKYQHRWGTNLAYMISGAASLPQNEVMEWIGKNRYSVHAILQALNGFGADNLDEEVYPGLPPEDSRRELVIIGGGQSVDEHSSAIRDYIRNSGAIVLHANYRHFDLMPQIESEQYFCAAGDSSSRTPHNMGNSSVKGIVVPVGPRFAGSVPETDVPVFQAKPFCSSGDSGRLGPVSDIGPLDLALGVASIWGMSKITLIGFDGYENATIAQQELFKETQDLLDRFRDSNPDITVSSATKTLYTIPLTSVYCQPEL